jgi:hypothetical protein
MADNFTLETISGNITFASDDITSVHYEIVKLAHGADGAATLVSDASPLPVNTELTTADLDTGAGTDTRAVVGIVLAADGAGALLPGDATNGAKAQITTLPAADRTTDGISATLATDKIMEDATELTPKFAVIDNASSGDNTLVAAVASKKVRVLSLFLVSAGAVNVRFESGASGTALTGQMNLAANGGFVLPFNPVGWFQTGTNTLLNLELSGATSVDGSLTYIEVT